MHQRGAKLALAARRIDRLEEFKTRIERNGHFYNVRPMSVKRRLQNIYPIHAAYFGANRYSDQIMPGFHAVAICGLDLDVIQNSWM
jgi:hypothetical protein